MERKLTISMADTAGSKTTKSFDKINSGTTLTDATLVEITNNYVKLTNAVDVEAKKVESTPLSLA